jgi:hypothetical protein
VVGPTGEVSFGGGKKDAASQSTLVDPTTRRAPPLGSPDAAKMEEIFGKLVPGDWIEVDHGKADGHSLVFASWASDGAPSEKIDPTTGKPVRFKVANCYSQLNNKDATTGGDPHHWTIGYPQSTALGVTAVCAILRPTADSGPPTTAEQLLPFDHAAADAANRKLLATMKKIASLDVDLDKLAAGLAAKAAGLLAAPAMKTLAPPQKGLCEAILGGKEPATISAISTLAALCQRLALAKKITGVLDGTKDAALLKAAKQTKQAG